MLKGVPSILFNVTDTVNETCMIQTTEMAVKSRIILRRWVDLMGNIEPCHVCIKVCINVDLTARNSHSLLIFNDRVANI